MAKLKPVYFKLNTEQENYLLSQPENGMGYQFVKVILKNGKVLLGHWLSTLVPNFLPTKQNELSFYLSCMISTRLGCL